MGEVRLSGDVIGHGAHGVDARLHVEQHAAHVGMIDDRRARRLTDGAPLHARAGIVARLLIGALGNGDALDADIEPRVVHHREHIFEAAMGLADEIADRPAMVAEGHDRGRAAVNAELVLDRGADEIVAGAERAVRAGEKFRHDEQRNALHPGGASGRRASTRWTMFSATSCSPQVMKIFVPVMR